MAMSNLSLDEPIEDIWKKAEEEGIDLDTIRYTGKNREGSSEYIVKCEADTNDFEFVKEIFESHNIEVKDESMDDQNMYTIVVDLDYHATYDGNPNAGL